MNQTSPVKRIAIFGSTGSIGTQALEVIAQNPDRFSAEVLTCNGSHDLLIEQALKFNPNIVVVGDDEKYQKVKEALSSTDVKVFVGEQALEDVASMDAIETFPASEGFFAFQDTQTEEGLLLNTASGIFYEFVPAGEIFNDNPTRLSLHDVKVGENYALIINNNAGLWGYNIGDTVKFLSTNPYRIVVTGRTKHFISAFGEHVIGEEVEQSLLKAAAEENVRITEFTVAPMIQQGEGKSFHEWFVEFENEPADSAAFALKVNDNLRQKNIYYDDLITGNILQPLKINVVKKNGFVEYMKSIGKLGGQNKVPRLSNDRRIADGLQQWIIQFQAQ